MTDGVVYSPLAPVCCSSFQICRDSLALGSSLPGGMKCPSCQHVSKDKAPKFCSECGQKMFPAARAPGKAEGALMGQG